MNSMDPIYSEAVADCLSSAHSILDLFIDMDPHMIRCLPTVAYVRAIYAIVILIKLLQSATDPYSQLGPFIDLQNIQIERYMRGLYNHLQKVSDHSKCHVGNKFLGSLIAIRAWCCKIVSQQNSNEEQSDELIEPLLHLNISTDPKLCPHRTLGVSLENKKFPSSPAPLGALPKHTTSPEWTPTRPTANPQGGESQSQNIRATPNPVAPPTSGPQSSSNVQYFIPNPAFPYTTSLPDFSPSQGLQTSPSTSEPFSFDPTPTSSADVPMDPFPSQPTADYYTTEYSLDEMEGWMPDLEFIEGLDLSSYIQPTNTQDWAAFPQAGS